MKCPSASKVSPEKRSANSDNETRKEALFIGMDSFIAKPFNMARFCDVVAAVYVSRKIDALQKTNFELHNLQNSEL